MTPEKISVTITPLKKVLVDSSSTNLQVLVRIAARAEKPMRKAPLSVALVIDRSEIGRAHV